MSNPDKPCRRCAQREHHPHDWMLDIEDDQWDWIEFISEKSGRERKSLNCGIFGELWPCGTKRDHVGARKATGAHRPE